MNIRVRRRVDGVWGVKQSGKLMNTRKSQLWNLLRVVKCDVECKPVYGRSNIHVRETQGSDKVMLQLKKVIVVDRDAVSDHVQTQDEKGNLTKLQLLQEY